MDWTILVARAGSRKPETMPVDSTPLAQDSPTASCPLCEGTGWKPVGVEGVRRVVRCDCRDTIAWDRRLAAARIPPRFADCDFISFRTNVHDNSAYNQSLSKAKIDAETFAREYPAQSEFGLLFMGPCGVGKTHLAVAILRPLLEKGVDCLFYDFRELLKEIQASYNADSQTSEMQVLAPVLETEVLLLDDLGASKPSAWVLDTVSHIINSRYNQRRVTLLTTNYADAPVTRPQGSGVVREDTLTDRIGERMRSRLYGMCKLVLIEAEDFRKRAPTSHTLGTAGRR